MENETRTEKSEKRKQVIWEFDEDKGLLRVSESSIKAEQEKPFSFKLKRFKDSKTYIESMQITSLINGKENGTIATSIDRLGNDIFEFKKYGVVIGDTYFRGLARAIEDIYLTIKMDFVKIDTNNRLQDLIAQVKEYISSDQKLIDRNQKLCYIYARTFDELALECGYYGYELRALREQLEADKYITKKNARYTILKRIKDTSERVIAFHIDKILPKAVKDAKDMEAVQESGIDEA